MTPVGAPAPTVSPGAWAVLAQHRFPGNIRELSHAIEHAMVLSGGREIDVAHLPPSMVGSSGTPAARRVDTASLPSVVRPLHLAIRDFEHDYLLRALKATDGKRTRTAELLGISRKTLWEKLRRDVSNGASPMASVGEGDLS
jgi:DNA-binding NtrC family response regulator